MAAAKADPKFRAAAVARAVAAAVVFFENPFD